MPQVKRSRSRTGLTTIHPAAAAIDIGATIHIAAVGPDRDTDPVRTFQTFTDDLHRLADWFDRCGIKTVAMSPGCLLDPCLRNPRAARVRGDGGQRPRCQARAGAQN